MAEVLVDFYEATSALDLVYIAITILSLIKSYKKGFVLSILSMAKWLFAYIITLIIFPRIKPYLKDIIDNEYVLDVSLGNLRPLRIQVMGEVGQPGAYTVSPTSTLFSSL